MFEVLFILTTIFVAYVVYAVIDEQKASPKAPAPIIKPVAPKAVPAAAVVAKEQPSKPTATKAAPKTKTAKPAAAVKGAGLKDPKTGDVAGTYSNYRFTKRWIKEALVAEGLLDKVYKNNELNADTEAAIKQAIAKLEAMAEYKA